ncbi:694_t:CDS:2, partial [Diversispora eburnea]
ILKEIVESNKENSVSVIELSENLLQPTSEHTEPTTTTPPPSPKDLSLKDPSPKDPSPKDLSLKDPSPKDPFPKDPPDLISLSYPSSGTDTKTVYTSTTTQSLPTLKLNETNIADEHSPTMENTLKFSNVILYEEEENNMMFNDVGPILNSPVEELNQNSLTKLYIFNLLNFYFIKTFISTSILPITTFSYEIEGEFAVNFVLQDISQLEPTTKVILDGGKYSALILKNGNFVITNVTQGSYLLEVLSRKYIYPKIRVDVDSRGVRPSVTITGSEWNNLGPSLPYPLELYARSTADYFMVTNPYIIMMGISVVFLILMPKMMAGLEALQELQQNQPTNPLEIPDISSTLANLLTGSSNEKTSNNKRN